MVILGQHKCVCVGGGRWGVFVQSMQCRIWPSCFTLSVGGVTDQKLPRKNETEQIAVNADEISKGFFSFFILVCSRRGGFYLVSSCRPCQAMKQCCRQQKPFLLNNYFH